ncbi:MAG: RHS repeat-associated core domain-containing protein, partial [Kiritimatiellae bacterium]|nr:RHS repeat-associated core domain-containing protein [Kiritimatiellia bacterium]
SYDAKSRRIRKVTPAATHTFFYNDWNLIEERIAYTNGTYYTIHYYWGKDLSETLQGAGGVGGLLYLTIDGVIYIPCFDNNGNITCYLDANGNTIAVYTYDAFGNTSSSTGSLSSIFRHRFSTKYYDPETGLYYYGYRFYHPSLMRWLTRNPIEEDGGLNLYAICNNSPISVFDALGTSIIVIKHIPGERPPTGWKNEFVRAQTEYRSPSFATRKISCADGKVTFRVAINPPNSYVDIYFRTDHDYLSKMIFEQDHVNIAREHEQAIYDFKDRVEQIIDCPKTAEKKYYDELARLIDITRTLKRKNDAYDAEGGPHVLY